MIQLKDGLNVALFLLEHLQVVRYKLMHMIKFDILTISFQKRNYPAGFTRTEYYLDWIKEQAGIN